MSYFAMTSAQNLDSDDIVDEITFIRVGQLSQPSEILMRQIFIGPSRSLANVVRLIFLNQ